MELTFLAAILLLLQPLFVFLFNKSEPDEDGDMVFFLSLTTGCSIFYFDNFFYAFALLAGINVLGLLIAKGAELKGYRKLRIKDYILGVVAWFIVFGFIKLVMSLFSGEVPIPSLSSFEPTESIGLSIYYGIALLTFIASIAPISKPSPLFGKVYKVLFIFTLIITPFAAFFKLDAFWTTQLICFGIFFVLLSGMRSVWQEPEGTSELAQSVCKTYLMLLTLSCIIYAVTA